MASDTDQIGYWYPHWRVLWLVVQSLGANVFGPLSIQIVIHVLSWTYWHPHYPWQNDVVYECVEILQTRWEWCNYWNVKHESYASNIAYFNWLYILYVLMYIYNIGLLTVNIEFIWRGWETGWKTSFSESFCPFRASQIHSLFIVNRPILYLSCNPRCPKK